MTPAQQARVLHHDLQRQADRARRLADELEQQEIVSQWLAREARRDAEAFDVAFAEVQP